ncbi:hypothetical protein BASA81_013853 [Batrachochytrium salamandrivorans]|nr:hypothetical protein BASA81_013853 [Batrachochytrium salamandrivorans]
MGRGPNLLVEHGGSRSDGDGDDEDDYEEGEYDDEEETTEQERYHKKNRLREFVRNFRDGEQFTYRDQLLRNHRRGEHRLEVAAREALGLSISVGEDQLQDVPHCQVILATQETAKEMRNLHSSDLNKLVVIPGIIISASRAKPKATSIAVTCVSCGYAKQIKLDSAFGGGEAPTRCWNEDCPARKKKLGTDNLVFLPDRAVFVDQQTLKLQEAPEMVPTGEMPRSMLCSVSNWLVDLVSPGMRVSIIGVSSVFQSRGMESHNTTSRRRI